VGGESAIEAKFKADPRDVKFISRSSAEESAEAGRFCVTQLAMYKGKRVFVKTFRFSGISEEMVESLRLELCRYGAFRHKRLAKLHGVFSVRGCISRITEYSEAGSLRDVLRECPRPLLADTVSRFSPKTKLTAFH
jgi:hypothetical protein